MIKELMVNKAKQYGRSLLNNDIKNDLDSAYYVAQGFAENLTPKKKILAKNVIDCVRNSILEVMKVQPKYEEEKVDKKECKRDEGIKEVIDVDFKVKNKK